MKKFHLFLVLIGLSSGLVAQITITQAEFNRPSSFIDTIFLDNSASIPIPSRGANMTYDFSSASPTTVAVEYDHPAASNPNFPGANSYTPSTLRIQQFQIRSDFYTALDATGYYPYGRQVYDTVFSLQAVTGNSTDSMYFPDDIEVYNGVNKYIEFPAAYGDSNAYKSVETTNFMISVQSFGLNKTPGTIKRTYEDKRAVVGWGNIIIPDKNGNPSQPIPVLMIKRYGKQIDSVFLGGSPAPPSLIAAFGTTQGATVYDTSYVFYTENFVGWVAVAFSSGNVIDEVRWRPSAVSVTASITEPNDLLFNIYPNPVRSGALLNLQTEQPLERIQILSLDGRVILEKAFDSGSEQRITLPESLAPGCYLLRGFSDSDMPAGVSRLIIK